MATSRHFISVAYRQHSPAADEFPRRPRCRDRHRKGCSALAANIGRCSVGPGRRKRRRPCASGAHATVEWSAQNGNPAVGIKLYCGVNTSGKPKAAVHIAGHSASAFVRVSTSVFHPRKPHGDLAMRVLRACADADFGGFIAIMPDVSLWQAWRPKTLKGSFHTTGRSSVACFSDTQRRRGSREISPSTCIDKQDSRLAVARRPFS